MVGVIGLIGYGIAATFTAVAGSAVAATGWMYRKEISDTYEKEKAEITEHGVTRYATELKDDFENTAAKIGVSLDNTKENIETAAGNIAEIFDIATSDNPLAGVQNYYNKSAQGDDVNADGVNADDVNADDDGFNWLKIFGISAGSVGILSWLFGGKNNSTDSDKKSGLGLTSLALTTGAAALAWTNKEFLANLIGLGDDDKPTITPPTATYALDIG